MLVAYYRLIWNAAKEPVYPYLEKRGIDQAHLDKGKALYKEVKDLHENKQDAYEDKNEAFARWTKVYEGGRDKLADLLEAARLIGNQYPEEVEALGVYKSPPAKIEDWLAYADKLYAKVLSKPAYLAILAKRQITEAEIKANLAEVKGMLALQTEAYNNKAMAEDSTVTKDEKKDELEAYCNDLVGWAKYALKERPQLLEALGIIVRRGRASLVVKSDEEEAQAAPQAETPAAAEPDAKAEPPTAEEPDAEATQ